MKKKTICTRDSIFLCGRVGILWLVLFRWLLGGLCYIREQNSGFGYRITELYLYLQLNKSPNMVLIGLHVAIIVVL